MENQSKSSAWAPTLEMISSATNQVQVLSNDPIIGERTLAELQMSDTSTLGAVALNSGGLLIDNGWLRILGSGHAEICGDLRSWNGLGEHPVTLSFKPQGYFIVAYDVAGGFFALHAQSPTVFYFAPDTLDWEDTEKGYTDFLDWALNGDLEQYYSTFRWKGWEREVGELSGSQAILIYPFLWTKEGRRIHQSERKAILVEELWDLQQDMRKQGFGS
ncbi:DUF2625 family protein [Saccharibacillus sp. JS10]|uniref:DUF2625 family protein n=1 Tax=Saccharibacillus sp. JS10 TaxID=2950552 RepID=UPI00210B5DB1|nr:DUF2625 family protein [Saccharibacillus sp. JS10]MCQ4087052.1 DUF2625 domain-containing protein [Saccharibacillus sp. JS10]